MRLAKRCQHKKRKNTRVDGAKSSFTKFKFKLGATCFKVKLAKPSNIFWVSFCISGQNFTKFKE